MTRQADDPFDYLGAKPDKGFGPEISMWPEVGRERQSGVGQKELREGVGEGWHEWLVDTRQRSEQSAWVSPVPVKEDRSRWVGIPSSFVEFSLEIYASVSLHIHKGNAMLHNISSCAWINPSILLVCSFSPALLIVFLVAMKKCAMPLPEPLVDHRP